MLLKNASNIKVLGSIITPTATAHAELNATLSHCYYRLNILRKIKNVTNTATRIQFVHSFVLSRLLFSMTSFTSLPLYHLNKLHKLVMNSARLARGDIGYKISCNKILTELNMLNFRQLIFVKMCIECHNIIVSKEPSLIYTMFNIKSRSCTKISLSSPPPGPPLAQNAAF